MPEAPYSIAWHVEPAYEKDVKRRRLGALARRALAAEGVERPASLSVALVDDDTIRDLNRRFRQVDAATDVLSFCLATADQRVPGWDGTLGEVVISLPTAGRQAVAGRRRLSEELAHLLVHGILHILGYDHESSGEAQLMRAREESLLGRRTH